MNTFSNVSFVLLISLLAFSCKKNKKEKEEDTFDRTIMLTDYAQYIIKPSYNELQTKVNTLKNVAGSFVNNVNTAELSAMQNAWKDAYTSWQYASGFNFGPAGEEGTRKVLAEEISTFPVSESKIDGFITNNNANFNDFNRDARGFLAVEFLIFNVNNDNSVIITQMASVNRRNYLIDLINHIKTNVDRVTNEWNGNYYNEFINNNGTSIGSSTSLLYNEFVKSFEASKNFKLGIPLGLRPGQTVAQPQLVEAYYSGTSLDMLKENIRAIENIWNGIGRDGVQRTGFKAYLESVNGGQALVQSTINQLGVINQALNNMPASPSLSQQIISSPIPVQTVHNELQKHTRFFKSDMSSILGISITYSSGDGD